MKIFSSNLVPAIKELSPASKDAGNLARQFSKKAPAKPSAEKAVEEILPDNLGKHINITI